VELKTRSANADAEVVSTRAIRTFAARLRQNEGYTLIELLTVLAILLAVLTPLVTSFVTGMSQEVDQTRREQAYANARLAIQRMRVDIHCSTGATSVDQNSYGGFTLTLVELNSTSSGGWCPAVIPNGDTSSGVQWCTAPYSGSSTRWVLYRFLGTDPSECGSTSSSTFQVDYISVPPGGWPTNSTTTTSPSNWNGNIWPDAAACPSASLPTIAVDLNVALDPTNHPTEHYEMKDNIALRNAPRCT
jgi:prepilin-type N-terminal cleavage/methylation domain-containing protein